MAIIVQALLLSLLVGSVDATRQSTDLESAVEITESESAESSEWMHSQGHDCSNLVTLGGQPVSCTVVKGLRGGMQANTNIVDIDGSTYVLKETHDPSTTDNLRKEKNIIRQLQRSQATYGKIPEYYLNFQAKQHGSEVLVMEFLEDWFDMSKRRQVSDPEVRAAAFFLALEAIYEAGVSHCDMNTGNAMFHPSDPTRCKIIDFGMAEKNFGAPGNCLAMNAMPDLGRQGAAWEHIYTALGAPKTQGSIYSVCGKCNTQRQWSSIVRQSQATMRSFVQSPKQPQEFKPVVNQPVVKQPEESKQPQEFKPVMNQTVVMQPEERPVQPQGGAMVVVNTRELARQIKRGTPIKLEGIMGKAQIPKIQGQALTFNFEADDGFKQFGVRIYWASNRGKLMALI